MRCLLSGSLVGSLLALPSTTRAEVPEVAPAAPAEPPDAEIVVTADRWEGTGQDVPMSVTVVTGEAIEAAAITHAEDLLKLVPNVDWVGASGRPRFLLIRGIGDLGTGNVVTNPTVGVLVDEVDLSGMPAALAMLDVDHVEVLRGPQGALYGPNALAGLIKVESRAPTAAPTARLELRGASRGTFFGSVSAGGSLTPRSDVVTVRAAAQLSGTQGFMENAALDRVDTGYRDELATRLRVRVQPSDRLRIDLLGGWAKVNGGYDHWSLFNTRTSWSDRPGEDSQETGFGAVLLRADVGSVRFVSTSSISTSQWTYKADFDWTSADVRPTGSIAPPDAFTDLWATQDTRQDGFTQELRLQSREGWGPWGDRVRWLGGVHLNGAQQDASTVTYWEDAPIEGTVNDSTYRRLSLALFGQGEVRVHERVTFTAGLRAEHAWQDYVDAFAFEDDEQRWLFGWRAALAVKVAEPVSLFLAGAQSSKLGGFNLAPDAPVRNYAPEVDRSVELGLRTQGADARWRANVTGFYVQRQDMQISEWVQRPGGTSADIFFYTDNAQAWNAGAEIELSGEPVRGLWLEAAVGLLEARIAAWSFGSGEGAVDYAGKKQAHAPTATFSFAATWRHRTGVWARAGVTGQGQRFLANNNEIDWPAYALLDLRLGWKGEHFGVSAWGRNLADATYAVAGFGPYFQPSADVPAGNFFRYGDGAVYGLAADARW